MKENGMKTNTGIILVMLGLVLYNLFKGSKSIIALFIVLIIISIYEVYKVYKVYKRTKRLTYDSMMYIVGILMLIVGIFYEGNYGNVSGSWFIPILMSVLIIVFIIITLLKGRKVVDRKSMKVGIVASIISILLLLLMMILGIIWS